MSKKGLFVVLAMLVLVLAALACGGSTPPRPTRTPEPTAIQWAPTKTPEPLPTPSVSPDEEYQLALTSLLEKNMVDLEGFAKLNEAASDDPSLFLDETWQGDMARVFAAFLRWGDEVRALVPPEAWLGVHTEVLSVAHHTDNLVSYYADGIDNLDQDMLDKARVEVQLAAEAMFRAAAEVDLLTGGL